MDFNSLKDIIINNSSFVITSHVNPDADAIGSELALYFVLKKLGKKISVINHSVTPYNLLFMDKDKVVEQFDFDKHDEVLKQADVLIALDLNQSNRIVKMEQSFLESSAIKVCIDHHQDKEEGFVNHFFVDTSASATGELIYDFIEHTKIVEFDYDIALQIYAAIMTDTGGFKYDRTTSKIHQTAAKLLELGVDPSYVFDQIYDQSKISKIKLMGLALASIETDPSGKISYMSITKKMLEETGALESEVDGFVNFCLAIENVRIGLLFFELKDGMKVSFRSKGKIPINKLAAEFGGGGHVNAAGTRMFDVSFEEKKKEVIEAAKKYLGEDE